MQSFGHPALADLGPGWAGWGGDYDAGFGFTSARPSTAVRLAAGNGLTFAFPARDAAHVRSLYALAVQNGG